MENVNGEINGNSASTTCLLEQSFFDEGTSHLDEYSESVIYGILNQEFSNITKIIVTHRLQTIKDCDMIYVLREGKIEESGNHQQLLEHGSYYLELLHQEA